MSTTDTRQLVAKLWNYCDVLRDDGVSTIDYVEQLTYLLFLKMAHERANRRLNPDTALAGVADRWTASVGDERHRLAALKPFENLPAAAGFVELEITQQRLAETEMFQQLPGSPRVLRRDHVAVFEGPQSAQRDVLQIADRRGDQVKGAGLERWQGRFHILDFHVCRTAGVVAWDGDIAFSGKSSSRSL